MIWQEVGDRIFVRRYPFFDQTIGVILAADGPVVIDTRSTHAQADELIADLRAITDLPISAVINTHGHYDHVFGNARFRPAPIWGHVRCASMVADTGERQRTAAMADLLDIAEDLRAVELTPPTDTFESATTLDLGDQTIELKHLGRGHTDNDIVVIAGDVVFAGDLLENGAPPWYGDSFPLDWAETGRRVLDFVRGPVAPGHGDVAGREFVERQVAELAAVAQLARQHAEGAIDQEEALRASPFPEATTRTALERARLELSA
jgi:glyoxylase-like metal-dependent hydrolase (beta-lactamase superfamily II)